MMLSKEETEYNHKIGLLPDRYYYQLNGKSAEDNYREIYMKRQERLYDEPSKDDSDAFELVIKSEAK